MVREQHPSLTPARSFNEKQISPFIPFLSLSILPSLIPSQSLSFPLSLSIPPSPSFPLSFLLFSIHLFLPLSLHSLLPQSIISSLSPPSPSIPPESSGWIERERDRSRGSLQRLLGVLNESDM